MLSVQGTRLVILDVPVVGMVGAVRYPPPVVGHEDGGVRDVAYQVIDLPAVGEAAVPTAQQQERVSQVLILGCWHGASKAGWPAPAAGRTSRGRPQREPRTWSLSKPVNGPGPPAGQCEPLLEEVASCAAQVCAGTHQAFQGVGARSQGPNYADIQYEVPHRVPGVLLPKVLGDGLPDISQAEGWRC